MDGLMILNSILAASTLYFFKEAHKDFKELVKRVAKVEEKMKAISAKMGNEIAQEEK